MSTTTDSIVTVEPHYLQKEAAASFCGLSVSTFEEEVRCKRIASPKLLTARRVGWALTDLRAWCDSRPVSDLPPPPNTGAKKPRRMAHNA